ncbi:hypothetical protein TeGR_g7683, partial [Tetraparma gracilis]
MPSIPPHRELLVSRYKSLHPGKSTKRACAGLAFSSLMMNLVAAELDLPAPHIRKSREKLEIWVYQALTRLNQSAEDKEKKSKKAREKHAMLSTEQKRLKRSVPTPEQVEQYSTNKKERKALKKEAEKGIPPPPYPLYDIWGANPDEFLAVFQQPKLKPVYDALLEPVRE